MGEIRRPSPPPASPASVAKAAAGHLHHSLLFLFPFRCARLALALVQTRGAVPLIVTCALFPSTAQRSMIIHVFEAGLAVDEATLRSIDLPVGASPILICRIAAVMAFHGLLLRSTKRACPWRRQHWPCWCFKCSINSRRLCRNVRRRQSLLPSRLRHLF